MERRLKMIIAGSIAAWVPVASPAAARPAACDAAKLYRLRAVQPAPGAESHASLPAPHNFR
jgi:hypothetical protein